mmetsp:Transcript_23813/g.70349  ORF Transcript_23813/g.70349 Transcript_23813/m.70349 type:complete len:188 (-) Transcript_23813:4-567(-)
MLLLGKYDKGTIPDWITPEVRELLRGKRDQVSFIHSSLHEVPSASYNLVAPSNILDWMEAKVARDYLHTIAHNFLAPNGYLLLRSAFNDTEQLLFDNDGSSRLRVCNKVPPKLLADSDQNTNDVHELQRQGGFKVEVRCPPTPATPPNYIEGLLTLHCFGKRERCLNPAVGFSLSAFFPTRVSFSSA